MGRRAEITERLKEKIADALLELLQEVPFEQIKVIDVAKRAKVGRASYFRYFDSKEDVLAYKGALLWARWQEENPRPNRGGWKETEWFLSFFCSPQIRPWISILYRRLSPSLLLEVFLEAGYPGIAPTWAVPQYNAMFFTYGLYGVLLEWVRNDFAETPTELAQQYQSSLAHFPMFTKASAF